MPDQKPKHFDCVAMKQEIQAQIYAETKDLSPEALVNYLRTEVEKGPFAALLARNLESVS